MILTLGLWRFAREWNPEKYGLWQCDDCGSHRCVRVRKARLDAEGHADSRYYGTGEESSGESRHHHHHHHHHHHSGGNDSGTDKMGPVAG